MSKITIFQLPEYFCRPEGVPFELGTGNGDQKGKWWGNWVEKKFDNGSGPVVLQPIGPTTQ